ncbi:MAG: metallophosphoesterase family protein [Bacteroidaceae bacterium]
MNRRDFIQRSAALVGVAYVGAPAFSIDIQTLGNPNIVIGVLSDIHLRDTDSAATFIHTLEYFRSQKVDGVIIAGDMADQGLEPQLKVVADSWYQVFPDDKGLDDKHTEKLFIYGNHDLQGATWAGVISSVGADVAKEQGIYNSPAEIWEKYFHETYTPIWMKQVNGYYFVGAHWHDNNIPGLSELLSEHPTELSGEKPFFYIQHPHLKNTCNGPWAWGQDDGTVTGILSRYPNAVAFSGHSHSPLNDDRNFWQDQFTSIGTSSLSYLYPMPARENTYQDDWSAKPPTQMANIGGDSKEGMLMKVYDGAIVFERREFVNDQTVADPWVMPLPISLTAPLTFENRKKTAPVPQFPAGAKVTVTQATGKDRYGVEQEQVTVHFPNVLKKDTGVRAFDYEVQVEHEWLDVRFISCTKRVFSPKCFMGEDQDTGEVVCVFGLSELPTLFHYRFIVRPCECFGNKGDAVYSDWITGPISVGNSTLSLAKLFVIPGENIVVSYKDAPVGTKAWIGLYQAGKNPGSGSPSVSWAYTDGKEGTVTLKANAAGEHYVVMFANEGYDECSSRVSLFVTSSAYDASAFMMKTSKKVYNVGDAVEVNVSSAPSLANDWVGIYAASVIPSSSVKCPTWLYYGSGASSLRLNVSGTKNWTAPLPSGIYFVSYFMSDGYNEPFPRQYFVVGTPVSLISEKSTYGKDENIVVRFSGMTKHLSGTICYQKDGESTLHELMTISGEDGVVELNVPSAGTYKLYVCVDGVSVSQACSIKVNADGTAVSEVKSAYHSNNIAYRLDGTMAGRADDTLPRGMYVINGDKILR